MKHIVALHSVEDKTVFRGNGHFVTSHHQFWNNHYQLNNTPDDVGFEDDGTQNSLVSKEVDCTSLQKYMLNMGPKYMNVMFDMKCFKLSEDVVTLINVSWVKAFRTIALFKIFLSCLLMGGLYVPSLAKPIVVQFCAPLHMLFMLASANMFRKNTRHVWLFVIDIITSIPMTINIIEIITHRTLVLELTTYMFTVCYMISIQQLLQMTNVPVIGYIDNVFINSMKLVLPVIFSVMCGIVVIDVLNIKQTNVNNSVDKFLLMYDMLSRVSFDFKRIDMQTPYNDYIIIVLIVLIIIVKAMCISVFFMVRDTVSDIQKSMQRVQTDEMLLYRLQFITSIWSFYKWIVGYWAFNNQYAMTLTRA